MANEIKARVVQTTNKILKEHTRLISTYNQASGAYVLGELVKIGTTWYVFDTRLEEAQLAASTKKEAIAKFEQLANQ